MLNIDDLKVSGLDRPPDRNQNPSETPTVEPWPIEPGSAAAVALLRTWQGEACTIIDAPPGSGKSHTIVAIATNLVLRAGLELHVACPTRAQANALAHRLADALPKGSVSLTVSGVKDGKFTANGMVTVGTLAGLKMSRRHSVSILIVEQSSEPVDGARRGDVK